MVTHFHTSPTLMRMRKYSIELYRRLQAEPGSAEHWHEVGSLRVASSGDQLRFLQRQVGMARAIGLDVDTISPAESLRIFPLMSGESLHGAMYLPGDGWLDPSGATMELAAQARRLGVELNTGVRVTGIRRTSRGAVAAVETDHGAIHTEIVINAGGMWASQIAAMVGVSLPITPLVHQHLATKPIPQASRSTPETGQAQTRRTHGTHPPARFGHCRSYRYLQKYVGGGYRSKSPHSRKISRPGFDAAGPIGLNSAMSPRIVRLPLIADE